MIRLIINLYIIVLIVDMVLSYFPQLRNNEIVRQIRKAADFTEKPVRNLLPPDLPFDFSPLIVILLLNLLMTLW
ncbi:MAG: YggT family protein [Bacteriovoracaceae bacterium]